MIKSNTRVVGKYIDCTVKKQSNGLKPKHCKYNIPTLDFDCFLDVGPGCFSLRSLLVISYPAAMPPARKGGKLARPLNAEGACAVVVIVVEQINRSILLGISKTPPETSWETPRSDAKIVSWSWGLLWDPTRVLTKPSSNDYLFDFVLILKESSQHHFSRTLSLCIDRKV